MTTKEIAKESNSSDRNTGTNKDGLEIVPVQVARKLIPRHFPTKCAVEFQRWLENTEQEVSTQLEE